MTNPDGNLPGYEGMGGVGMGIPVVGGIFDTWMQSDTARRNTDKTIAAQKAEAELAYQRQVAMWHMQNQYNSPEQQMQRFGAAGLNPHLIYGQGNPGNAADPPKYQAANLQYRYEAPAYGAAVNTLLPTMMAVGTWMQNMRLSEAELENKTNTATKTQQMIDFLSQQNPRRLQELDNKLSMYPYQYSMQREGAQGAQIKVSNMLEEFRRDWGVPLDPNFTDYKHAPEHGGIKGIEFLRKLAEQKLKTAQASWTDYNITNPQALIQLVLGGVMNMAGVGRRAPSMFKGSRNATPTRMVGKGKPGRWSANKKRWIPTP